ncbi:MAG: NfeD family protein, partial [Propionibacteriaceae bacterium]
MEWFTENVWALWLALGLVLATAEMLTLDLTLLMLSTGAFAACLVSLAVPDLVWVQALIGIAVSCSTLFVLRPSLLAKFRNAPGY